MNFSVLLLGSLISSPVPKPVVYTQISPIESITFERTYAGERFAVITLEKAATNPQNCSKAAGMEFVLDTADLKAHALFLDISEAQFDDFPISFQVEGCRFGYPVIVGIKPVLAAD